MKIIYVTATYPFRSGETYIPSELLELVRLGQTVLIVPRSPTHSLVNKDAAELLDLTESRPLFSGSIAWASLVESVRGPGRVIRAFGLLCHSRDPVIFLKNLAVFCKGLWLAQMARRWGAAHIHAHWAVTTATIALVASEVSGVPWSLTAHRWDIVENNLLALKVRKASFTRFISSSGLRLAQALDIRDSEKTVVLHMGVQVPIDTSEVREPNDCPAIILCPANLIPIKGHRYLLDALAILEQRGLRPCLWLAGDGELREQLRRQADDLGISDRVRFLGVVPHEKLLDLYRCGKVCMVVLPSVDLGDGHHEGIPVALMEAMSYGIPVISTAAGGVPELLSGGAGLLVPPGNPSPLADAIESMLRGPQLREQYGRAGRAKVDDEFNIKSIAIKLIQQFQRLTEEPEGDVQPGDYSRVRRPLDRPSDGGRGQGIGGGAG